jgi:hypothetical protein
VTNWQAVAQSLNIDLNPPSPMVSRELPVVSYRAQTARLKLGTEAWDWLWQRPAGEYRFPPFLAGKVAIKQPTSGQNGSGPPPPPPPPPEIPVAIAATEITPVSFRANWEAAGRAAGYRLDISLDPLFHTYIPGAENRDVGNVLSFLAFNQVANTTYHYRLRAYNAGGTSQNSNVIHVTTATAQPPENDNVSGVIVLTGLSGAINGTTVGATREAGEPAGNNSVWYSWRPNTLGLVGIRISTVVNRISIYRYDPSQPSGWQQFVFVADSVVSGGSPVVIWPAELGVFYLIRVFNSIGTAAFTLAWNFGHA